MDLELTFGKPGDRQCGQCSLCCKLLPVNELDKVANKWCQHAKPGSAHACQVYGTEALPVSCRLWSCQWLVRDDLAPDIERPDKCHYVLDIMPDTIAQRNDKTGEEVSFPVMQVWVDPAYPGAARNPALLRYIERVADEARMLTLIRFDSRRARLVVAPSLADDRQWHEVEHTGMSCDSRVSIISEIHERVEAQRAATGRTLTHADLDHLEGQMAEAQRRDRLAGQAGEVARE
jgi:hypothetical protein